MYPPGNEDGHRLAAPTPTTASVNTSSHVAYASELALRHFECARFRWFGLDLFRPDSLTLLSDIYAVPIAHTWCSPMVTERLLCDGSDGGVGFS
jgi:hypothetical protein